MPNTVPAQVVDFLRANKGTAYCDDCIRTQIGLTNRHQVQLVTLTLELFPEFTRAEATCSHCQSARPKKLTRAN